MHRSIALLVVVVLPLYSQNHVPKSSIAKPNLELRIVPSGLDKGLPKGFTFVFVNVSEHQLRMPLPTQCNGGNGTVLLRSRLEPLNRLGVPSGSGGGCGSGDFVGGPGVLEWAKHWKPLEPGQSLTVSYSRRDLFNFQEDAGTYEFWGEYLPPQLTTRDVSVLENEGFDFPRVSLTSAHLRFIRSQ